MTTQSTPVARTPLSTWHELHRADMVVRGGWQVPRAYAGMERELAAARAGLALADVSATGKLSLRGRGVAAVAERLAPNSSVLKPLGAAWIHGAEPTLACRLTTDQLLLLLAGAALFQLDVQGEPITVADVTSAYAGFVVVGPRTEELVARLTPLDVRASAFPSNSCVETQLAGVEALLVRTPEISLPSLRIYVAWDMAEYVWERMGEAGRDLSIVPLGLDALRELMGERPAYAGGSP